MVFRTRFSCRLIANSIYNPIDDSVEIVYVFEEVAKARKEKKKSEYQAYYTFDRIIGKDENFLKTVEYAKRFRTANPQYLLWAKAVPGKKCLHKLFIITAKEVTARFWL